MAKKTEIKFPSAEDHYTAFEPVMGSLLDGPKGEWPLANKVLRDIIDFQVNDPQHPHYGGWWNDRRKESANAGFGYFYGGFMLSLIHNVPRRLEKATMMACRESLDRILALCVNHDQHVGYTNYTSMALENLILGGELLENSTAVAFGRRKFESWENLFYVQAGPDEYATPSYTAQGIYPLDHILRFSRDPELRLRARLAVERLWLHALVHVHIPTRHFAGPHSRAYQVHSTELADQIIGASEGRGSVLRRNRPLHFPAWLGDYLTSRTYPYYAREVVRQFENSEVSQPRIPHSFRTFQIRWQDSVALFQSVQSAELDDLLRPGQWATVYQDQHFSLGSTDHKIQNYRQVHSWQRNNVIAYLAGKEPVALFSRHLISPKGRWLRSSEREGSKFAAIQDGPAVLMHHAPLFREGLSPSCVRSTWAMPLDLDEILLNGSPVDKFPVTVKSGSVFAARRGDVCWALRLLKVSGPTAGARVAIEDGRKFLGAMDTARRLLVFSADSYRGPRKRFTENDFKKMGCWWALEMSPRSDATDLAEMSRRVEQTSWSLKQESGRYQRRGLRLRLDPAADPVDGEAFKASDAVQNRLGHLRLDEVEIKCDSVPVLLVRRKQKCYEIVNLAAEAIQLEIRIPGAVLSWQKFPRGRMEFDMAAKNLRCGFDCLDRPPRPKCSGSRKVVVSLVSSESAQTRSDAS